ncbi:DUF7533 family protein [Natronococcus roseus]|uniref:DUF7533 family protein n=1 Tax=Natronococcus roseus TaxID=1052014 RepID=UPI00374D62F5
MAGIIDTIKLAGTLVLALPAALAGLEFLLVRGETAVGAVLIGLAIGLVLVQHRLTLPSDVPAAVAKRVAGTVRKDPDDADDR